jgi:hypothetical protein
MVANQFKINLMFTGSRQPLYTYGEIQMKLVTQEGINETFTLTKYVHNHHHLYNKDNSVLICKQPSPICIQTSIT